MFFPVLSVIGTENLIEINAENSIKKLTTISRSRPRNEAKWGTSKITGPKNLAPCGPISKMRDANASPSLSGGGCDNFSYLFQIFLKNEKKNTFFR